MRRFIASFMAILVMVLACIPCDDAGAVAHGVEQSIVAMKKSSDNTCPTGEHHTDHCSPFCTCSCCASVVLPQRIAALPEPQAPDFTARIYTGHPSAALRHRALPIWQPPQLG